MNKRNSAIIATLVFLCVAGVYLYQEHKENRVTTLIKYLKSEDPIAKNRALDELPTYGNATVKALEHLLRQNKSPEIKEQAIQILRQIKSKDSVDLLLVILNEDKRLSGGAIVEALGYIGNAGVTPLIDAFPKSNSFVQSTILGVLNNEMVSYGNLDDGTKKRIKELFLSAFSEKYPDDVRETAYICLKSSFGRDGDVRALLRKAVSEHENFKKVGDHFGAPSDNTDE